MAIGDPAQPAASGLVSKPNGAFKPRPAYSRSESWQVVNELGTTPSLPMSVEVGVSPGAAGGRPLTNKPAWPVSSPPAKMAVKLEDALHPENVAVAAEFQYMELMSPPAAEPANAEPRK